MSILIPTVIEKTGRGERAYDMVGENTFRVRLAGAVLETPQKTAAAT